MFVYDSLKGLQQLTAELARTLHIVGILFMARDSDRPVLSHAKLNQVAGKLPTHHKRATRIQVAARGKRKAPRKVANHAGRKAQIISCKNKKISVKRGPDRTKSKRKEESKGSSSSKRTLRNYNISTFRQNRTEDPADPISDDDFELRPTKQSRSTPDERNSRKQIFSSALAAGCAGEASTSPANRLSVPAQALRRNVRTGMVLVLLSPSPCLLVPS